MRAVVRNGTGAASDVLTYREDVPKPELVNGHYLVKVSYAGFNHLDTKLRKGYMPGVAPEILGLECSGVVVSAHGSVPDAMEPGTRICGISMPRFSCYADFVLLKADDQVSRVPDGMSLPNAAAFPVGVLTAYSMFENYARTSEDLSASETSQPRLLEGKGVLVVGCTGPVGLSTVALAKHRFGASVVVGVCSSRNVEVATEAGVDRVLTYDSESFKADMTALLGDESIAVVMDCYGGDANREFYTSLMGAPSTWHYFVCGVPDGVNPGAFRQKLSQTPRTGLCFMRGVNGSELYPLLRLFQEVGVSWPMATLDLSDGAAAHEMYETRRPPGKIVIKVNEE